MDHKVHHALHCYGRTKLKYNYLGEFVLGMLSEVMEMFTALSVSYRQ